MISWPSSSGASFGTFGFPFDGSFVALTRCGEVKGGAFNGRN